MNKSRHLRWRHLVAMGVALLLMACDHDAPPPALKVQLGATFPLLHLEDLQGKAVDTSELRGKPWVLNVWATWCPPCRKELPSLQRMQALLKDDGVVVLGMAVDDDAHRVREYLIDRAIQFMSYRDPQMRVANEVLGVRMYPATFIVDRNGVLSLIVEGEREWDRGVTLGRVRQVLGLTSTR